MPARPPRPAPLPYVLAVVAALVLGVAFRLYTRSDLWLDEALSANIAALPVGDLLDQLRHDGHPPLYYLLLHAWMQLFGEGDVAVRSLSGVIGIATLPLFWLAARRYAGRSGAIAGLVLLAASPFAVRYSTEARMYALVMFFVVAGWLVIRTALERPAIGWLALVALLSGLLALTHYWSFYLLAASGLLLLWLWRQGRPSALRVAVAILAGGVLFVPWLPAFLDQAGHTGTPWGRPERPTQVATIAFTDWGGGPNGEAQFLGVALFLLIALALLGRARDGRRIELDLATVPAARPEVVVALGTMVIAVVASYATGAAFASRYTAVVFPLVLLLAGLGTLAFSDLRVRAGILVVLALLGLLGAVRNVRDQRTQLGLLAEYIVEQGSPGDVVAFCPDQLGPATMRYLPEGFVGMTFPNGGDPRFVDWADYEDRQRAGKAADFAALVDERGADHTVWLVWADGYRTLDRKCERTVSALRERRPGGRAVRASGDQFEHAWLYQYGPVPG